MLEGYALHIPEMAERFPHLNANTSQRPKWEEFDGYAFLAMKMLDDAGADRGVTVEHVSLILGPTWVLSFLE
ncbi:hypothetical protein KQ303_00620, partial [Synechococcus sp. CS-1333]|nr:hypothetical protein [Synechococcus sp. CS-1333]